MNKKLKKILQTLSSVFNKFKHKANDLHKLNSKIDTVKNEIEQLEQEKMDKEILKNRLEKERKTKTPHKKENLLIINSYDEASGVKKYHLFALGDEKMVSSEEDDSVNTLLKYAFDITNYKEKIDTSDNYMITKTYESLKDKELTLNHTEMVSLSFINDNFAQYETWILTNGVGDYTWVSSKNYIINSKVEESESTYICLKDKIKYIGSNTDTDYKNYTIETYSITDKSLPIHIEEKDEYLQEELESYIEKLNNQRINKLEIS